MNILREFRKVKNKSPLARVRIIVILLLMLVMSTYAWWWCRTEQFLSPFEGTVNSWEVYYVDAENHLLDEEVTMQIENFFPGTQKNEVILVKNMGNIDTNVNVEITSVKLYFEGKLIENGEVLPNGKPEVKQLGANKTRVSWEYALYDRIFTCYCDYAPHIDGNLQKFTDYVDTVYNSNTTNTVYSTDVLQGGNIIRDDSDSILPPAKNSSGQDINLPESKLDIWIDWKYDITDSVKNYVQPTNDFDKLEITFKITSEANNYAN